MIKACIANVVALVAQLGIGVDLLCSVRDSELNSQEMTDVDVVLVAYKI